MAIFQNNFVFQVMFLRDLSAFSMKTFRKKKLAFISSQYVANPCKINHFEYKFSFLIQNSAF